MQIEKPTRQKQETIPEVWSRQKWSEIDRLARHKALAARDKDEQWIILARAARAVLKKYSTSFFIVTRFLPSEKRAQVEAIYAAVRYPDEIVDSFPLSALERLQLLNDWERKYENALLAPSLRYSLESGMPSFVIAFAEVVRNSGIPAEYYRSFLDAMRRDVQPRPYETLDDLIENYIYGSAIVVGYFLAYVYGAPTPADFSRAMKSARDLGIALQLTNFLRDVAEDQRRGRVYLPKDMLAEEGIEVIDARDPSQQHRLRLVLERLTGISEAYYNHSLANLDAFNEDSRIAIRACIDVYRQLNQRIALNSRGIDHRESVPMYAKFKVLPTSKYWRLPLEYLRAREIS
jgi:phytoene synthase